MSNLLSFRVPKDNGVCPNPYFGTCTLAICKPRVRERASVGDWVVSTGASQAITTSGRKKNFSNKLVCAMKVTEMMTMSEYDSWCQTHLPEKLPQWNSHDAIKKVGDCVYDFSSGDVPTIRPNVNGLDRMKRDLGGKNVLLSNHFYYFGSSPISIPLQLREIVIAGQGYKKVTNQEIIAEFEEWLDHYTPNKVYAAPQLQYF